MSARLSADFRLAAYRARLAAASMPFYVVARGDETAGAFLVKVATLDGRARLFSEISDLERGRVWTEVAEGPEAEIDDAARRRRATDPDLWVIEVEDRAGGGLIDGPDPAL